jgi:hypothetical protein
MAKKEIINSADQGKEVEVDRTHLRKDSQAIDKFSIGTLRDGAREEGLRGYGGKR